MRTKNLEDYVRIRLVTLKMYRSENLVGGFYYQVHDVVEMDWPRTGFKKDGGFRAKMVRELQEFTTDMLYEEDICIDLKIVETRS